MHFLCISVQVISLSSLLFFSSFFIFYCPDALGKVSCMKQSCYFFDLLLFVVAGLWYAKLNVCIYVVPSLFFYCLFSLHSL